MTHLNESLVKYTAIYRCCDDIINLKIRIRLTEVENLNIGVSDKYEEVIFKWQQKVFSNFEKELYKNEKNCVTDLEKKYHLDVLKLPATESRFDLYSYINEDDFTVKEEINHYFMKNVEEVEEEYDYKNSLIASMQNLISHNHDFETMFIMADLGEFVDTTWIKNEQILCSIKFDSKLKVLVVFPDFTNYHPYDIKITSNTARHFQYFIENISQGITEEEEFKENELIKKINNNKLLVRKEFIDVNFVLPPKNKLQVNLFFEILWAKQFEYGPIYIQYFIDLPPDWSTTDQSKLEGVTPICHVKCEEGVAHFSHIFDLIVEYNIEALKKSGTLKCPYIYFEVISKDTWNRYRTEGLSYKNLPVGKPGIYQFELQCFRLIPEKITSQMRRFFIGDCSNYSDITSIGVPRDYDNNVINKYGTNTVGTGQLGFRVNVMYQSQAFLEKYNENVPENQEIFEKLNSSSLVKSVEQVLQAFKRARKNMIAARKNL